MTSFCPSLPPSLSHTHIHSHLELQLFITPPSKTLIVDMAINPLPQGDIANPFIHEWKKTLSSREILTMSERVRFEGKALDFLPKPLQDVETLDAHKTFDLNVIPPLDEVRKAGEMLQKAHREQCNTNDDLSQGCFLFTSSRCWAGWKGRPGTTKPGEPSATTSFRLWALSTIYSHRITGCPPTSSTYSCLLTSAGSLERLSTRSWTCSLSNIRLMKDSVSSKPISQLIGDNMAWTSGRKHVQRLMERAQQG